MIEIRTDNLIAAKAEALVNTVNCVGIMGKGIALQFRLAFPDNFLAYQKACRAGEVQTGRMFVFFRQTLEAPHYLINFPTKQDWRSKSKIKDIESGLKALVEEIKQRDIRSIAIPPLGCGNGGLQWQDVRPLIETAFEELPEVQVLLFEPGHRPEPARMKVGTQKPRMTLARALVISLMKIWPYPEYRFSQLEIQKLAYFLQDAGETELKLNFVKAQHGPYADALKFLLQTSEGHYIQGVGDGNQVSQMVLLPDAVREAEAFLTTETAAQQRLKRVAEIIEGYEDPYGMELLATVHWIMKSSPAFANDPEYVIAAFQDWNEYKRRTFRPEHIRIAWQHLQTTGI